MAEVGLAAFSSIVSEGSKSLFKLIIRQISYVFKHQSYIDGLKDQVKQLGYRRETVQQPVNHARLQGDEIYEGVTDWLNKVDEFISEGVAKSIIDDEDRAKKSCFKGLCPNLISRYQLSKQAAKAAEAAASLEGKGTFSSVSYRPAPKSTEYMPVKDYEAFDSRTKVFQDVVDALKDDSFKIIGVYGMGGVGKTTLVKQVRKQVMEDKLFDKVVMAEVTQTPDHHKIQDKLAFDLGMEFDLNENEFQRASRLCQRLKQEKRLLIILDNIWTKLEFDKVGIPYGDVDEKDREDDRSRRTIILTSRSRDLLCNDMNSQKNFWIDALSKDEALQLFEKIVGDSKKTYDFQPTADEIVEKCGGLPVALRTVASALKNKSLASWKDALNQLRSSNLREIRGMDADVYSSIKLSYDFLESDEAKSLFLLCTLFGEGHPIYVHYLLRYGMGLGLFRNVYTLEAARNRVDALIDSLKASCLLLDGDAEDEAKMHDVIHVVAVSIAAEKLMFNIPNVADFEREMEETIRKGPIAISLPYRDIQELPERLECPQLKLFFLFAKHDSSLQISHLFFEGAEELKVLDFTGIFFSSLPSSLGCLINVQTLCLDGCRLNDIAIVGQLKKLEILSFRDSDVKELPLVIGQLTRLQLLDLRNCSSLVVIAPNVISKLSRLEELYIGNSFSQWEKVEGGSNASLAELNGLSKLTTLEIHVRDAEILPQDLVSVELQSYRICIGNEWWSSRSVKSGLSRLMKLQGLEKFGILLQNYRMKLLLERTEYLYLKELKGVQNVVHELDDGEGFPRLKHLHVESCSEILHIVGSVGRVRRKVFPLLESLSLWCLSKLETICDSQLTEDQSFSNLRIIIVRGCDKLKHLFSFSMAKNLLRLQKVEVLFGGDLEMIVGPDREKPTTSLGFNEIIADDDTAPKVRLPRVEVLLMEMMDNLRRIWHHQLASESFSKLKNLDIWWCDNLRNIFPPLVGIPSSLVNLKVSGCPKLEEIVGHVGQEVKENRIAFSKLKVLILDDLPRLTSFCLENYTLEFPSLERVSMTHCPNMKNFSHGILSIPKPCKVQVTEKEEGELHHWEGNNLSSTIQKCYDEMIGFLDINRLQLSHFPRLQEIWHGQALPVSFFNNLAQLVVDDCTNMSSAIPANLLRCLNNLEWLEVRNCDSIEEVFHFEELNADKEHIGPPFPKLSELRLIDLPKLKRFCNFTGNIIEPPKLENLTIENCPDMETFISNSVVHVTTDNKKPEKLTSEENFLLAHQVQPLFDEKVAFPKLRKLRLSRLHKVQHLWKENAESNKVFANLESLKISECSKLQKLVPPSWHLENLEALKVSKCHGLINVLTFSTSESLVNLQRMKIADCKMIEEIIQSQVGEEAKDCIVFRELEYLTLDCLPSLTSFSLGNYALEFPSLKQVVVRQCPKMKIFSQGVLDTPMLNKVNVTEEEKDDQDEEDDDDEACWEGNLNDTIKKLFNEMVSIN
ncbi:Disease resistance protein [Citrus sinensis]|uniref:Disease resistance protein n=1 Tax=Citrus sinensis TaxID=2711 RepID=A0ACB8KFG3_CITSI|nr:Disease resistance protein [Citrus sinensis]